jgi:nucleotide-binding universal stress UspA family protein
MRVLLAIDGSTPSEAARNLAASLRWPEGTSISIVAVVEPLSIVLAEPAAYEIAEDNDRAVSVALASRLAEAGSALEAPGRIVETRLAEGRPASVIVEEARESRADLIIVGSRGLGRLRSMVLGSVSAEVVDHAPCPVLVARGPSVGRILLATDGSASARLAVDHLAANRYLAGHRVDVISVGPSVRGGVTAYWYQAPGMTESAARVHADRVADAHHATEARAASVAQELRLDGIDAHWTIGVGDPAHEIIEAATNLGCDLIVMGSRGLTGIERIFLGSVARNVLQHTRASVLIVREPVRERLPERPHEDAVSLAAASAAGLA